jgi:hypothetical protein
MGMQNLPRQIRLMMRGEMLALQARLAFTLRRTLLAAVALLFAGLGLVFVNIGVYAALTPLWGPVWTPLGLGLINMALALAALGLAAILRPGPEAKLAEEIRNMAGEQIDAEIRALPFVGQGGGGLDRSGLTGLIVPALISLLGAALRGRKGKA